MKKDDLFKYFMKEQRVFHIDVSKGFIYDPICQTFNCDCTCILSRGIETGDYLVTEDNFGLFPDFVILYPKGNMLFFTLIE